MSVLLFIEVKLIREVVEVKVYCYNDRQSDKPGDPNKQRSTNKCITLQFFMHVQSQYPCIY